MTDRLREPPVGAAHASPTEPLKWSDVRRTLLVAAGIGVFMSFVAAFGTEHVAFLPRTLFMVSLALAGTSMGMMSFRLAGALPLAGRGSYVRGVLGALIMTVPMGLLVWGATWVVPHNGAPLRYLPNYVGVSAVMCQLMTAIGVFLSGRQAPAMSPAPPAPVKFLDRLPLKLRGGEVWAVEAEDHYLRLHTSKGQDLILMRLADAVAELEGLEGAQVHRSWWVARSAVADARRGDGRATLTLKDGSEVPVSRTYARLIREAGWI